MKIKVFDVIGTPITMSSEDGKKLFDVLYTNLKAGNTIELSFEGIEVIISHVLNESIGKLYEKFKDWDILDKAISYTEIESDDYELIIDTVIPTAKNHYSDVEKNEKLELEVLSK